MGTTPRYRGDDWNSFGATAIEIYAQFPDDTWAERVSLAEVKIGNLPVMSFESPVFPLKINLSSEQTALLKDTNECYMAVYDENGLKRTCEGQMTIPTRRRVV